MCVCMFARREGIWGKFSPPTILSGAGGAPGRGETKKPHNWGGGEEKWGERAELRLVRVQQLLGHEGAL